MNNGKFYSMVTVAQALLMSAALLSSGSIAKREEPELIEVKPAVYKPSHEHKFVDLSRKRGKRHKR